MESIKTMSEFTEVLKRDPDHAFDFISNNYYKLDKSELVSIIKELLYSIHVHCFPRQGSDLLYDVGIELDDQYEEYYQKG